MPEQWLTVLMKGFGSGLYGIPNKGGKLQPKLQTLMDLPPTPQHGTRMTNFYCPSPSTPTIVSSLGFVYGERPFWFRLSAPRFCTCTSCANILRDLSVLEVTLQVQGLEPFGVLREFYPLGSGSIQLYRLMLSPRSVVIESLGLRIQWPHSQAPRKGAKVRRHRYQSWHVPCILFAASPLN